MAFPIVKMENKNPNIILIPEATFVPNVVSFAASIAELAHGESRTQSVSQPAYLMCRKPKLSLRKYIQSFSRYRANWQS